MNQTRTIVCNPPPADVWVVRIPKPRMPSVSSRAVRYAAVLALSVGFNVGFVTDALAFDGDRIHATPAECQASAELHCELAGPGNCDDAYEDALEACHLGMTYTAFVGYEPDECERIAGRAYDLSLDPADYETTYHMCVDLESVGAP